MVGHTDTVGVKGSNPFVPTIGPGGYLASAGNPFFVRCEPCQRHGPL